MPAVRHAQFASDIQRARDLVGLGQSIGAMTSGLVDSSDIYRAALVQSVASLDSYLHGVILDRAVDILLGRSAPGSVDKKVGLPFGSVSAILNAPSPADAELAARASVSQRLSLETYQRPDDIASALSMVGVSKIWSTAFAAPETIRTALSLVVRRRNRIVHQCDADPLTLATVTAINDQDALDAITTIETVVNGLDTHC